MTRIARVTPDTPTNLFPENTIPNELPGVRKIDRRWISFDNINADPANNIDHRSGGNVLANQSNIQSSMGMGIYTSEVLPAVELKRNPVHIQKNGKTITYDYLLRDGYNRFVALKALGYTGYLFDVFEFGVNGENYEMTAMAFSAMSNREIPSQASTDADMANMLRSLLNKKLIPENLDKMKEWLVDYCGIRNNRATRIANSVLVENGNDDSILIYEPEQIKEVCKDLGIVSHGDPDYEREEYGFHIRGSYEREQFQNMLRRFRQTNGKGFSYATICTKTLPKPKQTIEDQRKVSVSSLDELEKDVDFYSEWKLKNPGKKCWRLLGALPQKKSEREKGKIIPII